MRIKTLVELLESEARESKQAAEKLKDKHPHAVSLIERFEGMSFGFAQAAAKVREMIEQ